MSKILTIQTFFCEILIILSKTFLKNNLLKNKTKQHIKKSFKSTLQNFHKKFKNPNSWIVSHVFQLEYLKPNMHGTNKYIYLFHSQ